MTFALLYLIHRRCPTSLHYTLHAHILRLPDHSQFLVVAPPSLPCSPPPSCLAPFLLSQASPCHRDTPRSHDDGGMHSRDGQSIESRLKVVLPEDLGSSLMDGVVLCHLANHIRPRSVGSIHVPSPAVPKLSMAKCRRNVENFLDACRKIGLSETVCATVQALVALDTTSPIGKQEEAISTPSPASFGVSETPSFVSVTTQTPPPAWQIWDLIGSSLLHVLCLVLLFVAYSWSELTTERVKVEQNSSSYALSTMWKKTVTKELSSQPVGTITEVRVGYGYILEPFDVGYGYLLEPRSVGDCDLHCTPRMCPDKLCLPHHILEEKGLGRLCIMVQALVEEPSSRHTLLT
ncbi:Leucine-rich repeat and calponin y domain-containing protein 1 [Liparis tanakae]|uniref:Leucine-rich repeat and calponin y domain-containing protein 1 n=1 Tax=Liparis tanakae TaxID=230148 RepID=A0A4Z2I9N8_9TELE|nr:Leucine-rich repeat and calponin y domain-containing protein 1 [Liparis tanakae]